MTGENLRHKAGPWTEARVWLLAASVLTIIAAICVSQIGPLYSWGGAPILVALGTLPFIAESLIQFRSWWRRLLWVGAGVIIGTLVLGFSVLSISFGTSLSALPEWILALLAFLLPATMETVAAWGKRKRSWIWLLVTPALFGLWDYWFEPLGKIVEPTTQFVSKHVPILIGPAPMLYFGASVFGAVLFTRALTGLFIAPRKQG